VGLVNEFSAAAFSRSVGRSVALGQGNDPHGMVAAREHHIDHFEMSLAVAGTGEETYNGSGETRSGAQGSPFS